MAYSSHYLLCKRWIWQGCRKRGCGGCYLEWELPKGTWLGCRWPQHTLDPGLFWDFIQVLIVLFLTVVQLLTSLGRRLSL